MLFECSGVTRISTETLGTQRSYTDLLGKPGGLIGFWREVAGWKKPSTAAMVHAKWSTQKIKYGNKTRNIQQNDELILSDL